VPIVFRHVSGAGMLKGNPIYRHYDFPINYVCNGSYMLLTVLMLCYRPTPVRRPIVSEPLVSFHHLSTGAT